ncbi:oxidoreductase [Verrucomicrobia bacterium LW23]|nr:oxidoreductase [Verrucomicrobia bacterium LW23]
MITKIKAGVIGTGHIGREHARIYSQLPNVDFVGIYDADAGVAQRIAQQYNIKRFASADDLVAAVDAATLSTPTSTHFSIGKLLLENNKHVLIEKPITDDPQQARELVQIAQSRNLVLQVGHIERFNPALRALEAKLTRPKFIEAHRLSPYPGRSTDIGVVLDLMIHDLDVVLHLVRSPIIHVDSVGVAVLSKGEDIANARIRFANGCVANLTTSRISPEKMRKIRVFQDDAYLSLDYQNQSGEIYREVQRQITREAIPIEKDEPLKLEIASFVDCVRARREPVVGGVQATEALIVAMQITDQIAAANAGQPGGAAQSPALQQVASATAIAGV